MRLLLSSPSIYHDSRNLQRAPGSVRCSQKPNLETGASCLDLAHGFSFSDTLSLSTTKLIPLAPEKRSKSYSQAKRQSHANIPRMKTSMRAPSKPRFLSLLLLGFLLLCLTAQTTARHLGTRTNAQPAASSSRSDTDDADPKVTTRQLFSSEKVPSLKVREPGEYSPDHRAGRRSGEVGTREENEEGNVPGHEAAEQGTGYGEVSEERVTGRGSDEESAGHGSRLRVLR